MNNSGPLYFQIYYAIYLNVLFIATYYVVSFIFLYDGSVVCKCIIKAHLSFIDVVSLNTIKIYVFGGI
jgi:hypothetical protein